MGRVYGLRVYGLRVSRLRVLGWPMGLTSSGHIRVRDPGIIYSHNHV